MFERVQHKSQTEKNSTKIFSNFTMNTPDNNVNAAAQPTIVGSPQLIVTEPNGRVINAMEEIIPPCCITQYSIRERNDMMNTLHHEVNTHGATAVRLANWTILDRLYNAYIPESHQRSAQLLHMRHHLLDVAYYAVTDLYQLPRDALRRLVRRTFPLARMRDVFLPAFQYRNIRCNAIHADTILHTIPNTDEEADTEPYSSEEEDMDSSSDYDPWEDTMFHDDIEDQEDANEPEDTNEVIDLTNVQEPDGTPPSIIDLTIDFSM